MRRVMRRGVALPTRCLRWAKAAGLALLAVVALVIALAAATTLLLTNLDHPWLKQRLVAMVEASTGLGIDYRRAQVSLGSGLRLDDITLRNPPAFQSVAPELLRLHRLEAEWSLDALLHGPVRIERIALQGLQVHWVANEQGEHSLSAFLARLPPDQKDSKPLSQQLKALFEAPPPVRRVEIDKVTLDYWQLREQTPIEHWSVQGLALHSRVQEKGNDEGGWALLAAMGKADAPARLSMVRNTAGQPPTSAELALALSGRANAGGGHVDIRLDVLRQDFQPAWRAGPLLQGALTARTDPVQPGITLELHPTRLADSSRAEALLQLPATEAAPLILGRLKAEVDLARVLAMLPADKRPLSLKQGRLEADITNLALTLADPRESTGHARLALEADATRATLTVVKDRDVLHWNAKARAESLRQWQPFLPQTVATRLDWRRMGAELESTGSASALFSGNPRLRQQSTLHLHQPSWSDVSARQLTTQLHSEGDLWQQQGELRLQTDGLRLAQQNLGAQRHTLAFDLDRRQPRLHARLGTEAGLRLALDTTLAFTRETRALRTELKAELPAQVWPAALRARAGIPAAFDTSQLAVDLELSGNTTGLVTAFDDAGTPALSADPLRTAAFQGHSRLEVRQLRWREDDLAVTIPAVQWQLFSQANAKRTLTGTMNAERIRIRQPRRSLTLTDLSANTRTRFAATPDDNPELTVQFSLGKLEQQPALPYAVENLDGQVRARRDATGVIHLPEIRLSHEGTLSTLTGQGRLELAESRRRLHLEGQLAQDLAGLALPERLDSRGQANVGFQLVSPDLRTFHVQSSVHLEKIDLNLLEARVVVTALDGDIPIVESFGIVDGKWQLLKEVEPNPYAMLRFTDQHPLLARSGYVSAQRITTPWATLAPVAGNLSVQQNIIALTQLETGLRGGRVTGQSRLDWKGPDSTLEARVRATGVLSSHGEPFDGNVAMVFTASNRSLQGRAEILRIGNRHLLDLLDVADPYAADPAINRLRFALGLGYPRHVRLRFDHGFGSLSVKLGGMAQMIRIDDIRGIPVGPIMNRTLQQLADLGP